MKTSNIKKPTLTEPLSFSYKVTDEDYARTQRRLKRADEIGLKLFVLDEEILSEELKNLEDYIVDNFIDLDKDIPNEIKEKYKSIKEQYEKQQNLSLY